MQVQGEATCSEEENAQGRSYGCLQQPNSRLKSRQGNLLVRTHRRGKIVQRETDRHKLQQEKFQLVVHKNFP